MRIFNELNSADMILVGLGEEFEAGMHILEQTNIYKVFTEKLNLYGLDENEFDWMYPIMLMYSIKHEDSCSRILKAYKNLYEMVSGKNYFIVSMNMDSLIHIAGFDESRIVEPFGSYSRIQCAKNCNNKLFSANAYIKAVSDLILRPDINLKDIAQEICDDCNSSVVPNTINAMNYNEFGYLKHWDAYQKWLMGTVNKKLVLLELGLKMQYPQIIKNPFDKILSYNQKAKLIRIGEMNFHVDKLVKTRSLLVTENAIDFFVR